MKPEVEIKSERIQHVVGKMPSYLVRHGLYVVMAVLLVLASVAYYVRFPRFFEAKGRLVDTCLVEFSSKDKAAWMESGTGSRIDIVHDGNAIYQMRVACADTLVKVQDGLYVWHAQMDDFPDSIRIKGRLYVFTKGSQFRLKIEGKHKSLFQHIWQDQFN